MRGWLVYDPGQAERNAAFISHFLELGKEKGVGINLLLTSEIAAICSSQSFQLLHNNEPLSSVDMCIFRASDLALHKHIELMGIPTFNASTLSEIANDKMATYQFATKLGIPVLPTALVSAEEATPNFGMPFVVKPRFGHGGNDVYLIEDTCLYKHILSKWSHQSWIVQKCASEIGKDLRVYVVGKKIIASMLRVSSNEFRSNYCLGGNASRYNLTEEEEQIVATVINNLDIGFAGIDIMFDKGRPVLNEIEDNVGSRMLYALTDIDPVDLYLDHILSNF